MNSLDYFRSICDSSLLGYHLEAPRRQCPNRGRAAQISVPTMELNVAPGSIVVIRDEEWPVTSAEQGGRETGRVRGAGQ